MALTTVPIRAKITLGSLTVETPYILSFNVKKDRNQKSTFSASLKVLSSDLSSLGGSGVTISAGEEGGLTKIFTGDILQSNPTPCWEDPKYVVLNISGADALHRLENEKYTRLQETSKSNWALITGINRTAKKGTQFKLVNHEVLNTTDGDFVSEEEKTNSYKHTNIETSAQPVPNDSVSPVVLYIKDIQLQEAANTV